MLRISIICIAVFWSWSGIGQEKTPFATYDFSSDKAYLEKRSALEKESKSTPEYNALIRLATEYKDFETAIRYYSKSIEIEPDNVELHYRLAGVNGIRIDEISKFKALPYVYAMKTNFLKAHQLDPTHTPTLTALVRIYAKLPDFLGGSLDKANNFAKLLFDLSPIEGLLAQGFILESEDKPIQAEAQYKSVFDLLPFLDACENSSVNSYFENRSQNLSYEIASIGLAFNLSSTASICALQYYVAQFDVYDNLPKEWAYYKLALLYEKINEKDQAIQYRSLALEINPTFNPE
ncbi:MAG: tetratricopeptide repeat protein [Flavobacteriales bacterium]|jgi:tetratricopeptide (TPR) repeat protein|tara:strand:+ start:969 stop:1844 length:876 start_codon:yes stop_codon:yes gene_type:complete